MSNYNYESIIPGPINYNEQNYLNDKYKNISNVSQLPNYYIKQPEQNKFIIKCSNEIYLGVLSFFICSAFLAGLICIEIFAPPQKKMKEEFILELLF